MNGQEIIEMARQFGLSVGVALDGSKSVGKHEDKSFAVGHLPLEDFVAFAKLIAAKEREACAKECEHTALRMGSEWMAQHCAEAIRARGQHE